MARAHFLATWDLRKVRERGLRRGEVLLDAQPRYYKQLRRVAEALNERQKGKARQVAHVVGKITKQHQDGDMRVIDAVNLTGVSMSEEQEYRLFDIEVTLDIHYRKRTLDQNALMWALYEVMANELNGDMVGDAQSEISAEDLYRDDMMERAPTVAIVIQSKYLNDLKTLDVSWRRALPIEGTDMVTAEVVRTSSKWNTVEMSRHIEGMFNRISTMGVNIRQSADISHYWHQFKQHVNDEDITLFDGKLTAEQYREATPICEGCGDFIGVTQAAPRGSGHLHHIKTRGAGGQQPERDWPGEWLMLCPECHGVWDQADGGVQAFITLAPHCAAKINRALASVADVVEERRKKDG
jgi:hypothetical protein